MESKYLEKLGYAIPDLARSVALQEDKFIAFQDSLSRCLQRYHSAIAQLSEAEVSQTHTHTVAVRGVYHSCSCIIIIVTCLEYVHVFERNTMNQQQHTQYMFIIIILGILTRVIFHCISYDSDTDTSPYCIDMYLY